MDIFGSEANLEAWYRAHEQQRAREAAEQKRANERARHIAERQSLREWEAIMARPAPRWLQVPEGGAK